MRLQSKSICFSFLAVIAGSLAFYVISALLGSRVAGFGARVYTVGSLAAVPASFAMIAWESRRPERAIGWPLILLGVSVLLPLVLMAIFSEMAD